ncbi:MAG: endonuclease/exonuclease/phosphatase family protein [Clostridia bacterium]|nr:endonuclease/exonuclease/phosphatase family protein [Clostridia bacterium]
MLLMSNNQWKCDKNAEWWINNGLDCSAEARVPLLVKAYKEVMPDILGLQEVSIRQAELMMQEMGRIELDDGTVAKYEYVSGGDTPIVYRRDKLKLLESGFFRYTEAIPGLEGKFNNSETKSYTWGVFECRECGKKIALMSTHLWWRSSNPQAASYQAFSDEAREYQIKQAMAKMEGVMAKYGCPGIIMGDFNAILDSLCLKAAFAAGWKEVHDISVGETDNTRGHHPCSPRGFSRDAGGEFRHAIDHILIKNEGDSVVECFKRLTPEYFDAVSDHYPLYIDLSL